MKVRKFILGHVNPAKKITVLSVNINNVLISQIYAQIPYVISSFYGFLLKFCMHLIIQNLHASCCPSYVILLNLDVTITDRQNYNHEHFLLGTYKLFSQVICFGPGRSSQVPIHTHKIIYSPTQDVRTNITPKCDNRHNYVSL